MPVDRSPIREQETTNNSTSVNHPDDSRPSHSMDNNAGTGVSVVSSRHVELPPFYQADPRLWFAQVDLVFANFNITSDTTKFRYVATQLSGEALRSVSDLVINPPAENKYETIKRRVMSAYDEGDEAIAPWSRDTRRETHGLSPSSAISRSKSMRRRYNTLTISRTAPRAGSSGTGNLRHERAATLGRDG